MAKKKHTHGHHETHETKTGKKQETHPIPQTEGSNGFIACTPKFLEGDMDIEAAKTAIQVNPINAPVALMLPLVMELEDAHEGPLPPEHLAVLTSRYWGQGGVRLTVGFMEQTSSELANRILLHMNAWSEFCNVKFVLTNTDPQVRISRGSGGYWSYLGTDILGIPKNEQTMNLESFTANTPESEFVRVIRHETGHTLAMPHEHLRREIVSLLDANKTIAYFQRTQGWSRQMVIQQVLTPVEERSLMGTTHADQDSIMAYQLPGSITRDGQPIRGGNDIDEMDKQFVAKIYPLVVAPPPPPPPPPPDGGETQYTIVIKGGTITVNGKPIAATPQHTPSSDTSAAEEIGD